MDATARFLLGGALGAALGYLLSQRNLQKTLEAKQTPSVQVGQITLTAPSLTERPPAAKPAGKPGEQPAARTMPQPVRPPIVQPQAAVATGDALFRST